MDPDKLATRLTQSLPLATSFSGVCYRNVSPRYATQRDILSTTGSRIRGGRYNLVNTFEVLYLSCDPFTCLKETLSQGGQAIIEPADFLPRTIIGIEVSVSFVLDLTNHRMRRRLGLTKSILTDTDWLNIQEEDHREAVTQALGRLCREAGFEAWLVPSAVCAGVNLNIFPDRLRPTSSLIVIRGGELPSGG
jgi:RES domain-containing protein